jgi:nitrate reductase molybdenum cofactor assembly chaperone NarJ/NarW
MPLLKSPKPASRTLRALARLLAYPDAESRAQFGALRDALHGERALTPLRLAELDALVDTLARAAPLDAEAEYVALFDRGRATSLHLFEHVHGDSRDRGPAMVDLAKTYEAAGLFLQDGELPDFLPVFLEFASTQPPREARALLGEMTHIANSLYTALQERGSRYASVLGALLDLAGEKVRPVVLAAEEPVDAAWEEPPAFDGCSSKGQGRPDTPQPIRIVPRQRVDEGARS